MKRIESEGLRVFEGKRIKIQTIQDLFYHTENLQVSGELIIFTDKFGLRVSIPISDIKKIEELK